MSTFNRSVFDDLVALGRLTDNLDLDAGRGLPCFVLQDNLVVPSVFPLRDVNCQARLIAVSLSSDTIT